MIEVELKYELLPASRSQLSRQLTTMRLLRRVTNYDTYYDTANFDLLRQAVFVRVRNYQQLEFKFNAQADPAHLHCTEHTFPLKPGLQQLHEMNALFKRFLPQWQMAQTVEEAITNNGLTVLAPIENQRTLYARQELTVCVDQVEELGNFIEIEMQCEEENMVPQVLQRIQNFARDLVAGHQVQVGYVELWLQKHQPYAYALGKYHTQDQ